MRFVRKIHFEKGYSSFGEVSRVQVNDFGSWIVVLQSSRKHAKK